MRVLLGKSGSENNILSRTEKRQGHSAVSNLCDPQHVQGRVGELIESDQQCIWLVKTARTKAAIAKICVPPGQKNVPRESDGRRSPESECAGLQQDVKTQLQHHDKSLSIVLHHVLVLVRRLFCHTYKQMSLRVPKQPIICYTRSFCD